MSHQLDVLQIVEKLNKEHNCTVVMVLHDINHASRFSDEIIAMKEGEIVTTGSPEEIITNEVLKVFHIDARVMIDPYNGLLFVSVMIALYLKKKKSKYM